MNRLRTAAILAALLVGAFGAAIQANAGPQVVPVEPIHDFGKVTAGDKVRHDFVLRNDGGAPVQLREVRSDCACAVASYDETIAPGASGEVRVALDTKDLVGPLARTITVLTNDPTTPSITLTIKAEVQPILLIRPGYARYIYVQKEIPGLVGHTLYSADGAEFKVLSVKSPYSFLATSFREATEKERQTDSTGKQWRVETVLSPDSPVGPLAGWVDIATDHPKQKVARIAITGFVRPVIAVTPPSADLGRRDLSKPEVGHLNVQVFSTEAVAVTSVDTDVKGLRVELKPVTDGRSYRVALTLAPEMPKGDFRGIIRLRTNSPKAPLLEVPVSGRLE